jgi:uncharacterized repeat protein (TIGR01451 family)
MGSERPKTLLIGALAASEEVAVHSTGNLRACDGDLARRIRPRSLPVLVVLACLPLLACDPNPPAPTARLGLVVSHTGDFRQGQNGAQYTVLVTNDGDAATFGAVVVTETVPSGLTLVSMSGHGWMCPAGGNTCSRSDQLQENERYDSITVTVNVNADATSPQVNLVTVSSGGDHVSTQDDTFIDNPSGVPLPVLNIQKTHTDNFTQGEQGQYTLTVFNDSDCLPRCSGGPTTGTVTVTETPPSGETLVSMTGTGWSCPPGGTTCTRSDPLAGGGANYPPILVTVAVALDATSPQVNSATVSGGGAAAVTAFDSTVINPLGLSIAKTHSGNFTQGQQSAQYTVMVSNPASLPTTGTVTVTETVPSGLTLVSMGGTGWTCASGTTTCTRNDALTAGASYPSITVSVNVAAGATSPQVNNVTVSGGGGSASSSASDSTVILLSSPLVAVTISPSSQSEPVGKTFQFTALAKKQDGTSFDVTAVADWSSSNTSVAVVSQGAATGVTANATPVTITATYQGVSGSASLTVTAAVLTSVFVGPSTASVTVGNTIQFVATGTFSDGSQGPITGSVDWTSSAPDVAIVNSGNEEPQGLATGLQVSAQPVIITATDPTTNLSGTAQLTVIAESAGFVTLVSANAAGTGGGNQFSSFPFAASMTGRYVAFRSIATDLVTAPAVPVSAADQFYVRDTCIGASSSCTPSTQMVSVDNSTPPNAANSDSPQSLSANISGDGAVIVFDSFATNLGLVTPLSSVYERQICGIGIGGCPSSTILESLDGSGSALNSQNPVVSRDGRFIAFGANSGVGFPVFLRDTCLGAPSGCRPSTTLVSVDNSGNGSNGTAVPYAVSKGGRYVLFFDNGTNMPSGGTQMYIRDTCQQFGGSSGLTNCVPVTTTVSVGNAPPIPITDAGDFASMSDDGRYVEFLTANALVPNDNNGLPDLYIRDTCLQFGVGASFNPGAVANCTPTTALVSVADTGNATALPAFTSTFALDSTGRFVVFGGGANDLVVTPPVPFGFDFGYARDTCLQYGTAPNFNPGAVPGCTPRTVLVTLDSTGTPIQLAGNLSMSGDGHSVVYGFTDPFTNIVQVAIGKTGF